MKIKKCKIKKEVMCDAMQERFSPSSHGTGIRRVMLFNIATSKSRELFVYKRNLKDRGIFLNYCPWCGEKIYYEATAPKKKAKP